MNEERLISADAVSEELSQDRALRPKLLTDYVGQDEVCEQMDIFIRAALQRREALDHVLIFLAPIPVIYDLYLTDLSLRYRDSDSDKEMLSQIDAIFQK